MEGTRRLRRGALLGLLGTACLATMSGGSARAAVPPTPAGPHPRLFMSAGESAAYAAAAKVKGTAAASLVASCQNAIAKPSDVSTRGGADGSNWPGTAVACAFAYRVTQTPSYLTAAIQYWNAALADDQKIGDGLGCVAGVDTNWQSWTPGGTAPTPPILITITHDTGYPMRWYGPYIALTYDWLHDAPGVDEALRAHTRTCLGAWVDYYTKSGYHHDEPGANYNAGYVIGKALTAVALGGENGAASDRVWTETVTDLFGTLLIGKGLAGGADPVGKPAGVLLGGDWGEGWQYGPLSVLEYAAAARAVESAGAPLPEMDAWASSLVVRYLHASVPHGDGVFNANGDLEAATIFPAANAGPLDAVLIGPSSDQAAGWAAFVKQDQKVKGGGIWNAIAEARTVTPADYRAQVPAPPLWYLARGTRTVFARTSWAPDALWGVFSSPPQVNSDHHHFSAGNFVFSRGADHLIVDPSNYGEPGTLETNAPTADSPGITGSYAPSQTPWSQAELLWARGTTDAVFAARGDFAKGFMNNNGKSDIAYARREWVMLPEGEMVLVDRVQTADAAHGLYVSLHANTAGALQLQGATASGAVGASKVAIHGVVLGGATPAITQPMVTDTYAFPCGKCTNARFAVDLYSVKIPGPWAVGVHVVDALASAEAPAVVDSLNDDAIDPAPKQNAGVVGASVFRGTKQSYVVASSAMGGAAGATLTYGVPGVSAGRHVVFDAPEQADGQSQVTAAAEGARCVVTITAGAGVTGHPAMFSVSAAADGCKVSADTGVPPGMPPPGGGVSPIDAGAPATDSGMSSGSGGSPAAGAGGASTGAAGSGAAGSGGAHANGGTSGGCGCSTARGGRTSSLAPLLVVLAFSFVRRRPTRRARPARGRAGLAMIALVTLAPLAARAHSANFKSPGPGMHFTQGQPLVIFADLFDSRDGKGFIVCPAGQTVSNTAPPPAYSDPPRVATCSGGGTPTGWPAFQIFIDGVKQTDIDSKLDTIPHTIAFDHNINPSPIGFFRFRADSAPLGVGPHQLVVRGMFSMDGVTITQLDSAPLTIVIDAPPAKTMMSLSADVTGAVTWDGVLVVGNGHKVTASGALVIKNSLVTGLSGLGGSVTDATIEGSTFEDTGPLNLTVGNGAVAIKNNEFRANNRLTFKADDPGVPFIITLTGAGANQKLFQGNRVGAGQMSFGGQSWLVGGDTDAESNVFIGPRSVLNIAGSAIVVRGNYSHHNYRGAWSQGFNFVYMGAGSNVLTEHNFIRDSSWPLQYLAGEFRYNVVFGYGHTWLRTAKSNAIIHHNIFTPGGDGGLNDGIQCYGGESGLSIYNNTFDGGGAAIGDFAGPTVSMTGGSQTSSLRNNLVTFARDVSNGSPGSARITGGAAAYGYADYNAFYSPDAMNKTAYDFAGAGAHDVPGGANGQLAANPFAGARIMTDSSRMIESVVDEAAIWNGTQKVSQVLALFRARYAPKAGSAIIDAGDPQDNDSKGRRADIGAVDVGGHDQDKIGTFGTPPSELVPPTVTLTAPAAGAMLTGKATLSATAMDNPGGSGVVLVQFLVDGGTVAQTAASPYTVDFDTATLANGDHAFSAKAWDAAGNSAVSAVVMAHTMNAMLAHPDGAAGEDGGSDAGTGTGGAGGAAAGAGGVAGTGGVTGTGGATGTGGGTPMAHGGKSGCGCALVGGEGALSELIPAFAALAALLGRKQRRRGRTR